MDQNPPNHTPSTDGAQPEEAHGIKLREYDSAELFQGEKEVLIRHAGDVYRLRLTRNDKLILQK